MLHSRSLPTVALVVETGEQCDPGQIERLTQQLAAAEINATWIHSRADQAARFADVRGELAQPSWGVRCVHGELPCWAVKFAQPAAKATSLSVAACDEPIAKSDLLRLETLGIRQILITQPGGGSTQRTAAGIWQFGESFSTARSDQFFCRSATSRLDGHQAGLAVVRIDLAATRTARGRTRTARFVERLVARQGEQFSVVSLMEASAFEEARTVPRPQRSILRAA